jgi:hypothetical protein
MTTRLNWPGWRIPRQYSASTTIEPGGYIILWADNDTEQGVRHLSFRLNQDGEQVGIYQLQGQEFRTIDTVTFRFLNLNRSFGRLPDAGSNWVEFETATPGRSNGTVNIKPNGVFNQMISVYPNPSRGVFNLELRDDAHPTAAIHKVSIFAADGTRLTGGVVEPAVFPLWQRVTVDLTGYPPGVYIVSIRTGTGVHTARVMIR